MITPKDIESKHSHLRGFANMIVILQMMSERPTSIPYLCKTLGLSDRTVYRRIEELKALGVQFDNSLNSKYRISSLPEWLKNASESISKRPLKTPQVHRHEFRHC